MDPVRSYRSFAGVGPLNHQPLSELPAAKCSKAWFRRPVNLTRKRLHGSIHHRKGVIDQQNCRVYHPKFGNTTIQKLDVWFHRKKMGSIRGWSFNKPILLSVESVLLDLKAVEGGWFLSSQQCWRCIFDILICKMCRYAPKLAVFNFKWGQTQHSILGYPKFWTKLDRTCLVAWW